MLGFGVPFCTQLMYNFKAVSTQMFNFKLAQEPKSHEPKRLAWRFKGRGLLGFQGLGFRVRVSGFRV